MASDRYDPDGRVAAWEEAAALVKSMQVPDGMPDDVHDYWNTALTQAARGLETEGRKVKQGNGMYYRVLNGTS
jgi:hypothetical protein